jgi:hypothetical protein
VSACEALGGVLARIATATSVGRVRESDRVRVDCNGGDVGELRQRVEALIERLEHVARELEDALA